MARQQKTVESAERQRQYVEAQREKGLGLVFADAFLRGMRDIGYKSPAWAISEMVDNSIQAQATTVEVLFGHLVSERGGDQPGQIAVVDDGVGMIPDMISYAVRWGGTDREDDRQGFGRYGYGLPSSTVSMAKRYSVYSKSPGGNWHRVTVDVEELAEVASDQSAINAKLQPVEAMPPDWVVEGASKIDLDVANCGTAVVLENLDRLQRLSGWKAARAMKSKLLEHFGLIYRHWLPEPAVIVDGESVAAVDPLFLMEHARHFGETEIIAKGVEGRSFTVVSSNGEEGKVTIRASYLPPNFQLVNPKEYGKKGAKHNKRFAIMKANNGIHVCRDGREIQCIQPPSEWTRFQVYDRNVKIEMDFDPELDEFFGITTAKQQITLDEDMWERLRNRGKLLELIIDIRRQFKTDAGDLIAAALDVPEDEERPSERALRESERFKSRPHKPTERQQAEAQKNLEREATKISETERRAREEVLEELEKKAQDRPFKVEFKAVVEGPFYRPHRFGLQKQLIVNTLHPFYEKVYTVAPEAKAALEVLLLVLAEAELESEGEFEQFYKSARQSWSERLRHALEDLKPDETVIDAAAAAAAETEMEVAEA